MLERSLTYARELNDPHIRSGSRLGWTRRRPLGLGESSASLHLSSEVLISSRRRTTSPSGHRGNPLPRYRRQSRRTLLGLAAQCRTSDVGLQPGAAQMGTFALILDGLA